MGTKPNLLERNRPVQRAMSRPPDMSKRVGTAWDAGKTRATSRDQRSDVRDTTFDTGIAAISNQRQILLDKQEAQRASPDHQNIYSKGAHVWQWGGTSSSGRALSPMRDDTAPDQSLS